MSEAIVTVVRSALTFRADLKTLRLFASIGYTLLPFGSTLKLAFTPQSISLSFLAPPTPPPRVMDFFLDLLSHTSSAILVVVAPEDVPPPPDYITSKFPAPATALGLKSLAIESTSSDERWTWPFLPIVRQCHSLVTLSMDGPFRKVLETVPSQLASLEFQAPPPPSKGPAKPRDYLWEAEALNAGYPCLAKCKDVRMGEAGWTGPEMVIGGWPPKVQSLRATHRTPRSGR